MQRTTADRRHQHSTINPKSSPVVGRLLLSNAVTIALGLALLVAVLQFTI